jgi:TolB-like protein/class 3 adenylate cyclase
MPDEIDRNLRMEIAHVLFLDIVGYSKLLISEQTAQLQKLKELVCGTEQFRAAEAEGKLLRLATGDGAALVFRTTPEAPVLCALEVSKALKRHPDLQVRMGIHSGPVNQLTDLNEQANVAGAGINFAQRVMDCGDAGHILLSKRVADDLEHYPQWRGRLHELGECEVKHGVRISLVNLYDDEAGNPEVPEKLRRAKEDREKSAAELRAEEGFWVAVLPFKCVGGDPALCSLADGLSEEIVTGLSRFSYLKVIARSSASRFAQELSDVRTAGSKLGARYLIEGNLRQAGTKLRLSVQLVDTVSGAHLWAENYERAFSPEAIFDLQDDLVPRIVATVADANGVLPRSIGEILRKKRSDELSPSEAVLRYFGYLERFTVEEHAIVRDALERAVKIAPDQANCWAVLAMVYRDEFTHQFNVRPDPIKRTLAAAQRAVEIASSNHIAHYALASAFFFQNEFVAFRNAAERSIALNPMDSSTAAYLGTLMLRESAEGDWERGCALVERARQLNPNHPGWYWFTAYWDAYRKRDYRNALQIALKINLPGDYYVPAVIAAAHGQLGQGEAARPALEQLHAMKPDFAEGARADLEKWFGPCELVEHFLDGMRKAGMEIAGVS